jgi:hypothetical protein
LAVAAEHARIGISRKSRAYGNVRRPNRDRVERRHH